MQTALISYPYTTCSHLKLNLTILLMYTYCFRCACFENLLFKFCKINALSGCNGIWTYNGLLCKRTLNHLAKLAKRMRCVESTYLYGAFDCVFLSCRIRVLEWIYTMRLPECQRCPCSKQVRYMKFKWLQRDSSPQP